MKRVLTAVIMITAVYMSAFAAFESTGWTARSRAFGNAMSAEFDPVNSMHYNPATIAMARGIQAYLDWGSPYMSLNDGSSLQEINLNLVFPFFNKFTIGGDEFFTKRGALGLTVFRRSTWADNGSGGTTELYHEGIYSLFYAKDLNDVISRGAKISAGVKLSLYDIGVAADAADVGANSVFNGSYGRFGFGLDVGVTYDFSETIRIGLVFKNLIAPNVSILADGNDTLPGEFNLGGNWFIGDLLFMKKSRVGVSYISYSRGGLGDTNDNRQSETSYNAGFEFQQLSAADLIKGSAYKGDLLSVRLGASYLIRSFGLENVLNLTGGIGFKYAINNEHLLVLDYTMEMPANTWSPKMSLGFTYELMLPNSAFAYKDEVRKDMELDEELNKQPVKTNLPATNAVQPATNVVKPAVKPATKPGTKPK